MSASALQRWPSGPVTIQAWSFSAAGRRMDGKLTQRDGLLGRQCLVLLERGHEAVPADRRLGDNVDRALVDDPAADRLAAVVASRPRTRLLRRVASFCGSLRVCLTSVLRRLAACALGDGARGAAETTGTATASIPMEAASTAIQRTCPH
jgi:hypothetical protein